MALTLSTAAANAALDGGLRQQFVAGDILEVRSGVRPGAANTAPTGTALASFTLPATPFGAAATRAITAAAIAAVNAANSGTASWFRLRKSADLGTTNTTDVRVDGDVALTASDMNVDNTSINAGQQVSITSFVLSI